MGFISTATTQTIYLKFTDYGKYRLATNGFSKIIKSFGLSDNDVDYRRFNTGNTYIPTTDTTFQNCGGPTHDYPCSGQTIQTAPGGQGVERLSGCCFYNYPLERGATYTLGDNLNDGINDAYRGTFETVCNLGVMRGCSVDDDAGDGSLADHTISCPTETWGKSTLHWKIPDGPTPKTCFDVGYDATTLGIAIGCDCFDLDGGGTWDTLYDMTLIKMSWVSFMQTGVGLTTTGGGLLGDINGDGILDCSDLEYALCCHCWKNGTLTNGNYPNFMIEDTVNQYYMKGCPPLNCASRGFPSTCSHIMPT